MATTQLIAIVWWGCSEIWVWMLTSSIQVPGLTLGMRYSTQKVCASSCIFFSWAFLSSFLISRKVFMSYFKKCLLLVQCDIFQTLFYIKHLLSRRYLSSSLLLGPWVPRFVQGSHVKEKWMSTFHFLLQRSRYLRWQSSPASSCPDLYQIPPAETPVPAQSNTIGPRQQRISTQF